MNEALKIENLKKYFDEIGKPVSTNFLYGYEDPKSSSFFLLGSLAVVDQKYYIVAFFPDEIILAPLKRFREACHFSDTDPSKQAVQDIFAL